jgi:uncharacterized protein
LKKKYVIPTLIVCAIALAGCATLSLYKKIDGLILAGQYADADAVIEKEKNQYKGEHELLYYFDKGAVLQMKGDYAGSAVQLDSAENKIDSLYTKSATKEISSFFSNDLNLPYEGEDFEQVMVNIMKCLDYMYKGDYEGARVEAKKVDHRLNVITDRLEGKNIYKQDAFARYLSGIVFEALGEMNDAYLDYKKSLEAYQQYNGLYGTEVPYRVKQDVLRSADAMHFTDRIEEFRKDWGQEIKFDRYADYREKGELVAVVYNGIAPYKISYFVDSVVKAEKKGEKDYVVKVAFPKYVSRGYALASAEAFTGDQSAHGFDAEDINSIAMKTLENRNFLITAKAIARAVAKYQLSRAASNNGKNQLMGLLANIYTYASEQADTRSWRTLPAAFDLIRIPLMPGKYDIRIKLTSPSGAAREQVIKADIKKGRIKTVPVFAFNG